jgi:hypothetical protein
VIWQSGKPPLDAEYNLMQSISTEGERNLALRAAPSGFLGDAANPIDSFVTNRIWSNWFKFGPQFAGEKQAIMWSNVNGWLIPVTGTLTGTPPGSPNDADTWNRITLPPPPANTGDARIDFVFLEVWQARVPPNPSTLNKPGSSALYRYGNVEGGYTFLADDLQDPTIGFETTQRVQLQYRIRVVSNVGLASYPDGFDPATVKGQGASATATSFVFTNMRIELGDVGLWRAGDGTQSTLGSVDGYTYAVPIAVVFRRNRVSWTGDPGQNLNGAFDRNPTAVDRTGYKTFSTIPSLASALTSSALTLTLATVVNIPLPLTPATPVAIQIGDEILTYSSITGTTMTLAARGQFGSLAEAHVSGSIVTVLSGRPDGLFADQIIKDDILDLRHLTGPSLDYEALLRGNLDRLLRGRLRATWKRTGGGPQGSFVFYQDKISASPGALGVTKLDAPDGIRQVWGDPVLLQAVVIPINTPSTTTGSVSIGGTLGAPFSSVVLNHPAPAAGFQVGDIITVPKSLFIGSLPGSDVDQITLVAVQSYVKLRFLGESADLSLAQYSVANNGSGDLLITFTGSFVVRTVGAFITMHVLYGAGRGLSRRPDAIHSLAYLSGHPDILLQIQGLPADNQSLRTTWLAQWSRYRNAMFNGGLPSTCESYADPGSKTVVLTPFRRIPYTAGSGGTPANSTFKTAQKTAGATLGAMPANTPAGGVKWVATDPLALFSNYLDVSAGGNMVVVVPRRLLPGWGEVRVPILPVDSGSFAQGINFCIEAKKGSAPLPAVVANYVPQTSGSGSASYQIFSTTDNFTTFTSAVYNTSFIGVGNKMAGMRFFTDGRGLGRQGLELPPFYGIARLFAVYEAQDYGTNNSAFDPTTREPLVSGGAKNLLRQNFSGPTFWIESDVDGDPTFILNADVIDITKSPNPIASFSAADYVIEASIFGCDRGFFDFNQDARIVLNRGWIPTDLSAQGAGKHIVNPVFILPGAPQVGDEIAINYSRTPYQGDVWGSQSTQSDLGYKPGTLTTAIRYQLLNTELTYSNLTRPNQKVLEVLASVKFVTTLGTGRLSGDVPANDEDVRVPGYEPWLIPATAVVPRATPTPEALSTSEKGLPIGNDYLGMTERLPLGALFRDKDFRGNYIGDIGPFSVDYSAPGIQAASVAPVQNLEYETVPVHTGSVTGGSAGETVVHVDGNDGNYSVLTNYRTNRGGSAFSVFGHSGGDVGAITPPSASHTTSGGVLAGLAMLVRNVPTNVGANEVSAGDELLLLIATTARPMDSGADNINAVQVSTSGTGEGYGAADLYRLTGHPITNNPARSTIDPSTVVLARASDLLLTNEVL